MASCGPTPERRSLDAGVARPSVATGTNAFEITNDRVFGPGGEALARRFARRVLAFDEVHSLGFDPDRATATLNFRLANGDPGMLLTRLAGAVAPCAAEVKEIELPTGPMVNRAPCNRHSSVVSIFAELSIANGCLTPRQPALLGLKHCAPAIRDSGGGSIINISSVDAIDGGYFAAGLAGLRNRLREDFAAGRN